MTSSHQKCRSRYICFYQQLIIHLDARVTRPPMSKMARPRSPEVITSFTQSRRYFIPRSGSRSSFRISFLFLDLVPDLVPRTGYNHRFITPSTPSEKEVLPIPYITCNSRLFKIGPAVPALFYIIILKVP